MKKLKLLLVIFVCLLSFVGVTYAAHYATVSQSKIFDDGDTFTTIEYLNYTKYNGEPTKIRFFAPTYENGELNGCKYILVSEEDYVENKTYTVPDVEGYDYIWKKISMSWEYACEYPTYYDKDGGTPTNYHSLGSENFNVMAYPKYSFDIVCDKEEIKEEESTTCEIYVRDIFATYQLNFKLNVNNLAISDITLLNNNFTYDETTNMIYAGEDYSWSGFDLQDKAIVKFTVSKIQEGKNANLKTSSTSTPTEVGTIEMKNIVYRNIIMNQTGKYHENDDVVKTIEFKGKEVPITTTTTTTKPTTTKPVEKEEVENPKTGVEDHLVILSLVITATGIILYQLKDKNIFRKI